MAIDIDYGRGVSLRFEPVNTFGRQEGRALCDKRVESDEFSQTLMCKLHVLWITELTGLE